MFHKNSNRFSLLVVVMMVLSHIIFFRYFFALNFASVWIGIVSIPKVFDERESRDKHRKSRCVYYLRWPYIMGLFAMYERRLISTLLTYIHPSDIRRNKSSGTHIHIGHKPYKWIHDVVVFITVHEKTLLHLLCQPNHSHPFFPLLLPSVFFFLFFILLWSLVF